ERAYTSTCAPNQKFAGMEQDSATGLYRTIFRQYAANNGRWLSPDPYRGSYDPTNPQTMNRYAYVGNMPMNHIDPMGLNWACTFGYSEEGGGWELNCWYISTCADFNDCRTSPTGPSQPSGSGGQGAGGGKSQPPPQPQPQQQKHTCHELNVYANQLKVVGVATALVGGGIALIPGAQPIGAVTALSGGVVNLSGNLVSLGTSIFCK
ncbi:MAG TPA: RHS repeat-associated core domain-containing protein, partial [Candidatus Acidoferrales bacterium]|nr:RHS repeat-associated core domain-containing protein [Candidatus Acidoferrales bacterium]